MVYEAAELRQIYTGRNTMNTTINIYTWIYIQKKDLLYVYSGERTMNYYWDVIIAEIIITIYLSIKVNKYTTQLWARGKTTSIIQTGFAVGYLANSSTWIPQCAYPEIISHVDLQQEQLGYAFQQWWTLVKVEHLRIWLREHWSRHFPSGWHQ